MSLAINIIPSVPGLKSVEKIRELGTGLKDSSELAAIRAGYFVEEHSKFFLATASLLLIGIALGCCGPNNLEPVPAFN